MHDDKEIHLACGCGTHELHITQDVDIDPNVPPMWYGSFWIRGYKDIPSWRFKLRCIWYILRNGTPYGDEVVLERSHLQELGEYVKEQLQATEPK